MCVARRGATKSPASAVVPYQVISANQWLHWRTGVGEGEGGRPWIEPLS
ncbi:hypothetical protein CCHR01_13367 [Colletotrichum chrysophilum]|uniref:Uncharacterized protein n=1 Tax=Colletotrichum chrysophilum TaxID=1836956 RepID=A0AAD9AAP5_9PEZI|nr:hypothetical protein CCHR01_13367 [Colletotrichum chrysophilum]